MKPKQNEARFELKLPNGATLEVLVAVIEKQLAAVKAAPDYANQPKIQEAYTALAADAATLKTTLASIATMHATLSTLITNRSLQLFALRVDHEALQTAINVAGKGVEAYLLQYGGNIATRAAVPASTDAPLNAALKLTKTPGEVHAKCQADRKAYAYAFQFGTDPANPDAWPKPAMESKCSYIATGLPLGQKVYARIAILRRGVGQGQWSDMLAIAVR
jgi:hypothetical protein